MKEFKLTIYTYTYIGGIYVKWKMGSVAVVLLLIWLLAILVLISTLSIPSVVEYLPFIGLESFMMPFLGFFTTLIICIVLISMAMKLDKIEKEKRPEHPALE